MMSNELNSSSSAKKEKRVNGKLSCTRKISEKGMQEALRI